MDTAFVNSLIITIPATLLPLTVAALAAYGFSWISFPFRDDLPGRRRADDRSGADGARAAADNFPGEIANASVGSGSRTRRSGSRSESLLRNFFITLPRDLIEAARVDGASNLRIFLKVVIPLSVPALAAYGIFQFLWVWNDLLMAFIFIQNGDLLPMTVRINQMQSTYGGEWHLLSAGAFLLMIVPLLVFFALQRYFVQGLLAGSVK